VSVSTGIGPLADNFLTLSQLAPASWLADGARCHFTPFSLLLWIRCILPHPSWAILSQLTPRALYIAACIPIPRFHFFFTHKHMFAHSFVRELRDRVHFTLINCLINLSNLTLPHSLIGVATATPTPFLYLVQKQPQPPPFFTWCSNSHTHPHSLLGAAIIQPQVIIKFIMHFT
jgi:hypothetical protein